MLYSKLLQFQLDDYFSIFIHFTLLDLFTGWILKNSFILLLFEFFFFVSLRFQSEGLLRYIVHKVKTFFDWKFCLIGLFRSFFEFCNSFLNYLENRVNLTLISYLIVILVVIVTWNIYWILYIHNYKINIKCYFGNQYVWTKLYIQPIAQTAFIITHLDHDTNTKYILKILKMKLKLKISSH